MLLVQILAVVVLFFPAPMWAQSGTQRAAGSDSQPQTAQPPQAPADPDKKTSPDQESPAAAADSTQLEPVKTVNATYPDEAREKQLQGQVLVKMLVSETGDVEQVDVISGDPILAKAAVEAAKKWKFKPFIRHGKPTEVSAKWPFDFAFSGNVSDAKPPQRVRVSSGVISGLLIHKVAPIYPVEARRARIQGTVVLQAEIGKDGRIADLHLISGPHELASAAIGAVQQWRYKPYLLAGEAVEVETQIQVNFQLSY
jgi:TonB family protein